MMITLKDLSEVQAVLLKYFDLRVAVQLAMAFEIIRCPGELNQAYFIKKFGFSKSNVSRDLNILEAKGLVIAMATTCKQQRYVYYPSKKLMWVVEDSIL